MLCHDVQASFPIGLWHCPVGLVVCGCYWLIVVDSLLQHMAGQGVHRPEPTTWSFQLQGQEYYVDKSLVKMLWDGDGHSLC